MSCQCYVTFDLVLVLTFEHLSLGLGLACQGLGLEHPSLGLELLSLESKPADYYYRDQSEPIPQPL